MFKICDVYQRTKDVAGKAVIETVNAHSSGRFAEVSVKIINHEGEVGSQYTSFNAAGKPSAPFIPATKLYQAFDRVGLKARPR